MTLQVTTPSREWTDLAKALQLPASIAEVLWHRGVRTEAQAQAFLSPDLQSLAPPDTFSHMSSAVERLRQVIGAEEPIALYADRDVDGLAGMAILARSLRSLGGVVRWGNPLSGRGVERAVLERLLQSHPKVVVFVDCGSTDHACLRWLSEQGVEIIVADHHRFTPERPPALAWIHPELQGDGAAAGTSCGCVMAFKLAQALWTSYLGKADPERLDYFLFDHLDLVSLGILADRVPLTGENRTLVWHGLRRLAHSRKAGLACLTRFFHLTPRSGPITAHEAVWRLIPLLNAAGRLGRPEVAGRLLMTEDPAVAWECVDALLELNSERRSAQTESLASFEQAVASQCSLEEDPVLVALAEGLEPSMTGLAAQALAQKHRRPTFLFVNQGEQTVGSGRAIPGVDLFAWVQEHSDMLLKFGGHEGAVGLTLRTTDFEVFRHRLLEFARRQGFSSEEIAPVVEADVSLSELQDPWWDALQRLEPFGPGHPCPVFRVSGIESLIPASRPRERAHGQEPEKGASPKFFLQTGDRRLLAEFAQARVVPEGPWGQGPWTVLGYPAPGRKREGPFRWVITDIWRDHG
jgi:single-stranded-DNA-specific exonuclease